MQRVFLAALSLLLAISIAQARGPYGSIHVGNWSGGAFTNDANGEFASCTALAPYKSGITVLVVVTANMTWKLGFSSENWNLNSGQGFPMVLTFDGQQPFNVQAAVIGPKLVALEMPDNSALITQFRKSKTMSAFAQGHLFQFAMTGTAALLPTLINCVTKVKQVGLSKVGDFTVDAAKTALEKSAAATAAEPGTARRNLPEPSTNPVPASRSAAAGMSSPMRTSSTAVSATSWAIWAARPRSNYAWCRAMKPTIWPCFRRRHLSRRLRPSGTSRSIQGKAWSRSAIRSTGC